MNTPAPETKVIWDPVIRVFHWSLALAFVLDYAVLEEGETAHEWAGYYCLAIMLVRVIWGFVGPRNARFADFMPTKAGVRHHLGLLRQGQVEVHDGHNPAGGLMVLALMAGVTLTGLSGWMLELDLFWGEDWAKGIHELFANLTMTLVLVHVTAVVFFSWYGPDNLIYNMLTGRRRR
ncbi:cytochrome b/b6 domain-containing protein [Marinobacterium sedimentorum]|uniref:cytochrome b/b6 domain-containing protein n=1 Tax=Marinobacterium sedimentorum TaxID=2927804 RepID=UPI0020C718ED|nr:cytochrome b/b6 domain-containing protein [Marinobacterium sedimentorum]MCP8686701.1 cytochrome b/b6 domain-containing protein [Marinobacterium sedimentorum]